MASKWIIVALIALVIGLATWALISTGTRVSQIVIGPGGDWAMTVDNPVNGGVATIHTDGVHDFHLTTDADAGGHRITQAVGGTIVGDALTMGQMVSTGSIAGNYPNLGLVHPNLYAQVNLPTGAMGAGTCQEVQVAMPGALPSMVATAAPDGFEPGMVVLARVEAADLVAVRVCELIAAVLPAHVGSVAVVQ